MRQGFELSRAEESELFEKATERLDIYVRLCLEDGGRDKAREFLSDGRYVRFALKEFTEQLFTEYPWPYDISPRIIWRTSTRPSRKPFPAIWRS